MLPSMLLNFEPKEKRRGVFKVDEITYCVTPGPSSYCGYICLPPSHPWYEKDYRDIEASILVAKLPYEDELTYSGRLPDEYLLLGIAAENTYCIGIDFAHYCHLSGGLSWNFDYAVEQTKRLAETAEKCW